MGQTQAGLGVVAVGFWLPVGRPNFFDPNRDKELIDRPAASDADPYDKLQGYDAATSRTADARLNASVCWRLMRVLPSALRPDSNNLDRKTQKRYSRAFPLYSVVRNSASSMDDIRLDPDPDALVMTCLRQDLSGEEWDAVRDIVEGVALLAVADGFYLWLALYDASRTTDRNGCHAEVKRALTAHIRMLVGGDYFNRARDDTSPRYVADKDVPTLAGYRDGDLGILSFFQINLILEGMYNAALDPRVYLGRKDAEGKMPDDNKRMYSLGNFIESIVTEAHSDSIDADTVRTLLNQPDPHDAGALKGRRYFEFFDAVHRNWMDAYVRRDLLRQFLRITAPDTLQPLKWRVESCSRLLLSNMIAAAHQRQQLIQAEIPPGNDPRNNAQERYNLAGANEAQLRGYVMLLAAKLPLIEDVQHYLDNNRIKLTELTDHLQIAANRRLLQSAADQLSGEADRPALRRLMAQGQVGTLNDAHTQDAVTSLWESLDGLWRAWDALLKATRDSIQGLEQALEQAHMDEMLAQTRALRDEEETRAEIERIQERTANALTPNADRTVSLVANVVAAASVLILVASFAVQLANLPTLTLPSWLRLPSNATPLGAAYLVALIFAAAIVGLVAIITLSALVYLLAQFLTGPAIRWMIHLVGRWEGRRRQSEERYYYEMDLELGAEVSDTCAIHLFKGEFDDLPVKEWRVLKRAERREPRVALYRGFRPERTSYHINRTAKEEALHKIYIAATVYWPRPLPWQRLGWWLAYDRMRIFVVYEVLFHRPSKVERYTFEKARVVSTTDDIISPERLDQLKCLVAEAFVNPWISDQLDQVTDYPESSGEPTTAEPKAEGKFADAFFSPRRSAKERAGSPLPG